MEQTPQEPKFHEPSPAEIDRHGPFIDEALELARLAVAHGNTPFGALLVVDGRVVVTAENTAVISRDVTQHAELNVVSKATRLLDPQTLARATLYASTEPCVMCTASIYLSGVPSIVYGCSQAMMERYRHGGGFPARSQDILALGTKPVSVVGPVHEDEAAKLHQDFWSTSPLH